MRTQDYELLYILRKVTGSIPWDTRRTPAREERRFLRRQRVIECTLRSVTEHTHNNASLISLSVMDKATISRRFAITSYVTEVCRRMQMRSQLPEACTTTLPSGTATLNRSICRLFLASNDSRDGQTFYTPTINMSLYWDSMSAGMPS